MTLVFFLYLFFLEEVASNWIQSDKGGSTGRPSRLFRPFAVNIRMKFGAVARGATGLSLRQSDSSYLWRWWWCLDSEAKWRSALNPEWTDSLRCHCCTKYSVLKTMKRTMPPQRRACKRFLTLGNGTSVNCVISSPSTPIIIHPAIFSSCG